MAYDEGIMMTYSWNALAFGAATTTRTVYGPKGRRARLVHVTVSATTTFAGTTPANIKVGDAGDDDRIMTSVSMGTTAAGALISNDTMNAALVKTDGQTQATVAADTAVLFTFTAASGGSPAGAADVHAAIMWQ